MGPAHVRRVVKIGGSLLLRTDLKPRLEKWLGEQGLADTFAIVGGGQLIDAVRRLDGLYPADPAETHWRCIDLLELTWTAAGRGLGWPAVSNATQLQAALAQGAPRGVPLLVAIQAFYGRHDCDGAPLDWRTTSDTLAAILALRIAAAELVILKSCPIPEGDSLYQLATAGIVDSALPEVAAPIPRVRVVQLG